MTRLDPHRTTTRRLGGLGLLAEAALAVAACTGSAGTTTAPTTAATQAPATSAASQAPAGSAAAGEAYEVTAATGADGVFLAGEDGKSLYVFGKDTANTSNCSGQCATSWPPFLLETGESVKAGSGVTGTLATITRADGGVQVTYNGSPLYYFAGDTKAGDVQGQGVNGIWYLAAAAGGPLKSGGGTPAPTDKYNY